MAPRHATLIAALTLTLVAVATPAPAAVADPAPPANTVQQQIDAHLRAYPGGVQTGPAEITYDNGVFVMNFVPPEPGATGVTGSPDCPAGWFCFYDFVNFGYPRGKLSDCGWQDLTNWGWQNRTESVHYNMSTASVAFIVHAAGYAHHSYDVAVFGVGTSQRTIADTQSNRNTADHVHRYC